MDRRPVEGRRNGGPPVDHDGLTLQIADMPAPYVEGVSGTSIDPPKGERAIRVLEAREPIPELGLQYLFVYRITELAFLDQLSGALAHGGQEAVRRVDVSLLAFELCLQFHGEA